MAPSTPLIAKLKVALKLSISRLRMSQQKEQAVAKVARRSIAQLLESGKEQSARIRVENIIRQDIQVELMEILELYCELLLARIGLMESKECDPGLEEAVKSLIYCAPRVEVKELQQVRQLLVEKYGKDFAVAAMENTDNKVSPQVLKKLRVEPPEQTLVTLYLKEIARTYNIPFGEEEPTSDSDENPSGGVKEPVPVAITDDKQAELAETAPPPQPLRSPISIAPPSPSTENVHPVVKMPDPPRFGAKATRPTKPTQQSKKNSEDDDLMARFAALKR